MKDTVGHRGNGGYWDVTECRWVGTAPSAAAHLVPPALLRSVELRPLVPAQRGAAGRPVPA